MNAKATSYSKVQAKSWETNAIVQPKTQEQLKERLDHKIQTGMVVRLENIVIAIQMNGIS